MSDSLRAKLARSVVRIFLKPALQPKVPVGIQRLWADIATRTLSVPFGVRFERTSLGGVPTEAVRVASSPAPASTALLYLHGGAFLIGSPRSHRSITGRLARLTGATVFAVDYRLAPEHPFPAALDDALAGYRALLDQGFAPQRIAVAGDSAGGCLALALCLRLRSLGLPLPACTALISPLVDMTLEQLAPVKNDALLHESWVRQGAEAYLAGGSARAPFVSPVLEDLTGLPPTLLHSATDEILRDDSRRMAAALTAAGVAVTHREFPGLWHDFQLYAGVVPEATEAVTQMAQFIQGAFATAGTARGAVMHPADMPA